MPIVGAARNGVFANLDLRTERKANGPVASGNQAAAGTRFQTGRFIFLGRVKRSVVNGSGIHDYAQSNAAQEHHKKEKRPHFDGLR